MTLNLKEQILQLWNEFKNIEYVAQKLGLDVNEVITTLGIGYADDTRDRRHFMVAEERAYEG